MQDIYGACASLIDPEIWAKISNRAVAAINPEGDADAMPEIFAAMIGPEGLPPFISDLANLELSVSRIGDIGIPSIISVLDVNPALEVLQLQWSNLTTFIANNNEAERREPLPVSETVLVWKRQDDAKVECRPASDRDLLVLKMVIEGITPREASSDGSVTISAIEAALEGAIKQGILLSPRSLLIRDPAIISVNERFDDSFCETGSFTLQWHITQTCDLHCKHCYDRSCRPEVDYAKALSIVDELHNFCRQKHVKGRMSLSGGNPLLYPHFIEIYRAAAEHGFGVSILGNPSPRSELERIVSIQLPEFFQVSLEGLQEHNDSIRGPGHFERTVRFLELLREFDIYSMVMLTLTQDNIEQVLPLGEFLKGVADTFNFNRLSMVGEGAALRLPSPERYASFLESYLEAAETNKTLGSKDNLINIIYRQINTAPFGGCTGFGCGAAFNFLALLSDGEVHACRKFPSLIGNIHDQGLIEIYDSEMAQRYRAGCGACRKCPIRPGCGGCLAIADSHGLDIFTEKDPYCFLNVPD